MTALSPRCHHSWAYRTVPAGDAPQLIIAEHHEAGLASKDGSAYSKNGFDKGVDLLYLGGKGVT